MNPTVISLFCGAGGMDYGFKEAGFDVTWGIDIDKNSCYTHKHWSSADIIHADIRDIDIEQIPISDVVVGSIIIRSFSSIASKGIKNKNDNLDWILAQIINHIKPKAFLLEGPKFLRENILFLNEYKTSFESNGYNISYSVLNAKDYGIAQRRERLVFIGTRFDLKRAYKFPAKHDKQLSVREAIEDLERTNIHDRKSIHVNSVQRWRGTRALDLDGLAPSIVSGTHIYIDDNHQKSDKLYTISWQEAAALQSFPKEFMFLGDKTSKFKQIENSFPPKLAFYLAKEIYNVLYCENESDRNGVETVFATNESSLNLNLSSKTECDKVNPFHQEANEFNKTQISPDDSLDEGKVLSASDKNDADIVFTPNESLLNLNLSSGENKTECDKVTPFHQEANEFNNFQNSPDDFLDEGKVLIHRLKSLPSGKENAEEYHRVIFQCLNHIFKESLKRGQKEVRMNEGRKRVDIVFNNQAINGFFAHIVDRYKVFCPKILIECKNYTSDPNNPEVDQLLGRVGNLAGDLGILVCRQVQNHETLQKRCKDALGKREPVYILYFDDNDIIKLINMKGIADEEGIMDYLLTKWDRLIMNN